MAEAKKVTVNLPRARGSEPKELFVGINGVNYLVHEEKDRLLSASK